MAVDIERIMHEVEVAGKAEKATDVWFKKETINGLFTESDRIFQCDDGTIVIVIGNHRLAVKFESVLCLPEGYAYARLITADNVYKEVRIDISRKSCKAL